MFRRGLRTLVLLVLASAVLVLHIAPASAVFTPRDTTRATTDQGQH